LNGAKRLDVLNHSSLNDQIRRGIVRRSTKQLERGALDP
jgi:hypothetical protein